MFESTATWMEEKVFPDVDDYHQYVGPWAKLTAMPITRFDRAERRQGLRLGGLQPLARRRVRRVDRPPRLGAVDQPGLVRPGRLRQGDPRGPRPRLLLRAGELRRLDRRVEGRRRRRARGRGVPRRQARAGVDAPTDGSSLSGKLDHTGYALFDVAKTNAPKLQLTGTLPAGTAGAIILVGRAGGEVWKTTSGVVPTGGKATVTLDNPGRYERITAVAVNGSYDKSGWNGQDWNWTRDQQPISVAATALTGGGGAGRRRRRPGRRRPIPARAAARRRRRRLDAGGGGAATPGATLLSVKAGAAAAARARPRRSTFTVRAGAPARSRPPRRSTRRRPSASASAGARSRSARAGSRSPRAAPGRSRSPSRRRPARA